MSKYKKSIIIFSIIIASLISIFLIYTYRSLVLYERNLVENYINYLIKNGALDNENSESLFKISALEKDNAKIKDGIKKLYKSDSLSYEENKKESHDDTYVYDIYNHDVLISKVTLKKKKEYKVMGILTSNEWEIESYINYFSHGLYTYEITIPETYKLYINDKLVGSDYITESSDLEGFEDLTKFIAVDKKNIYTIENLVYEPQIKITDENDKEVQYKLNGNKINVNRECIKVDTLEEANKYLKNPVLDILSLAENYSLFLTDDLGGERHGLYKLTPYMLEDTVLYDRAYSFSRSADILMVATHTFRNPRFSNEKLENFIIYNDSVFSVDVHLEKNMVVSYKDKVDILNDRFYFIYYNDGYKWVKSESIQR